MNCLPHARCNGATRLDFFLILVATLLRQTWKQWKEGNSECISFWLFTGQVAAQCGFLGYSWLLRNWVFLFTNAVLLVVSLFGLVVFLRNRAHSSHGKR